MTGRLTTALVLTLFVGLFAALHAGPAQALPPGFSEKKVMDVPLPTALDFTPDGRMLVTTQSGTVRVVENNVLLASPAVDLTPKICTNAERGLLGIAVTPPSPPTASSSSTTRSTRAGPAGRRPSTGWPAS